MSTEFIELAGKINQQMPVHCVERIERALNDVAKPVRGSKIAILGVSYKAGVGDLRESPALRIMEVLNERGAELTYHDSYVPSLPEFELENTPLETAINGADAVVLVTAHPDVDYTAVVAQTELLIDLRGTTRGQTAPNVIRL
jgi:UDP-N-acetyl-D-glucosamine dehydrogenase